MKFEILTLFPEMIMDSLRTSILGRAMEKGIISARAVNIRDYADNKHHSVDDYTYGGGAGMLMQAQPVYDCIHAVLSQSGGDARAKESDASPSVRQMLDEREKTRVIYVTPQGRVFDQAMAEEFSGVDELIFLCGHYEGIDERVLEETVTDYVSIGDYVLTGGELPALVMIDAIARLIPGVLGSEESAPGDSFQNGLLEYPQYSRPAIWHGKEVPQVLLSGDHAKVEDWRLEQSIKRTGERRPDLYAAWEKTEAAAQWRKKQEKRRKKAEQKKRKEAKKAEQKEEKQ
ncbi:MAG: tRNA (guanosine(37)-N1)-methyltransferase TrmD [Lachnospiraceae bacterium]|nr:tRNA (guanosine(37)-N1)-methyltransferase TrmD [Lachnospiraceae bacterium]